ncbi:hypothetical protein PGH07_11155 [Sulfurovum sp. zt1-1]|uniref:Outer membrane porin, OprD family n=1 Tax=Sulfurovum zhangzhouensis TaxID=3019067 RepID=A0ABT7R0Y1_9BACT|nr:hypothetical protein [Sulfurovum zhangzhouensis]MDM5272731.1 hypothetical protein [Sulfurovum zhangzhouensis]
MKKIGMSILAATALASTAVMAGGDLEPAKAEVSAKKGEVVKRKLKGNMVVEYNVLPGSTDSLTGMFQDGIFYGRLRSNSFYWDWDHETWDDVTKKGNLDNKNMGVGGSLIFKSAALNGFSFTAGYYGSLNPGFWRMDVDEIGGAKAGKDTFSRYDVLKGGSYDGGMHVLGEAYLEYNNNTFDVKAGRQLFESVFTASNDTKMIPNTFDGVSVEAKVAKKTTARVAYFAQQKLRDHTGAHDVVTFKDENGESWNNNDDAAVHKGLSYANFVAAGEDPDHELIVADINTKAIPNLNATLSFLSVPGVVNDIVAEAHYTVGLDNGWSIVPGFRYFHQMDNGGGDVAGYTNLSGKAATGYDAGVADSLDSSLFAARIDVNMPDKKGLFRFGYSDVADKADIVAPWRGFPTGGFTRAMAQYNWFANTRSYMARAAYKFTPQFEASLRYAIQDFDDAKTNVQADSNVWHLDTVYKFTKNFYMKTRVGLVDCDTGSSGKADTSYNEYRLEFNYLF